MAPKKVLMVCLGNICRSPIAEGVFTKIIKDRNETSNWIVDSAGTSGWHVGNSADERSLQVMKSHAINYTNTARGVTKDDFNEFDYIFGMDNNNVKDLNRLAPKNCRAKIFLLGDFDPKGDRIIQDPYYDSGLRGFEKAYEQCSRSIAAFLDKVKSGEV